MGMTIDEAITVLGMVEAHGVCIEAKDIAVETMRKYQKIEEIVNCELIAGRRNYKSCYNAFYEIVDVIQD